MKSWMKNLGIAALAACLALPAMAQEDELKALPGYVDFGSLEAVYGEPKVMINIGGMLLSLLSQATKDDPETSELMQGLKGVRINVYNTGGETLPAMEKLQSLKSSLTSQNWEPIVQVNEDDENVQIFVKLDQEGVQGMTVMAVDDEEAVFLNILGSMDPDKLGEVMKKFDVDVDMD